MRASLAWAMAVSAGLAAGASAEIILYFEPVTIEIDVPAQIVVSAASLDDYVLTVDRIAFDFDAQGGGVPTDPELVLTDFDWLGDLYDPSGRCSSDVLSRPYSDCGSVDIVFSRSTPIARLTLVGTRPGVFNLASNLTAELASDGSTVHATEGDPAPIEVLPEPDAFAAFVLLICLLARRRAHAMCCGAGSRAT